MGIRSLILLRHGQYISTPEEKLTDLGRAQASIVAARLAELNVDAIISSGLPRAKETATFIAMHHPNAKRQSSSLLNERLTYKPRTAAPWAEKRTEQQWEEAHHHVERAYHRFFKSSRSADRVDILVCHGNIIRTLLCRALGFPVEAWLDLRIHHCGVSVIEIDRQRRRLKSFNDIGHFPLVMQTEI